MLARDFVFYLDGLLETKSSLSAAQVAGIKDKLQECFKKETPSYDWWSNPTRTTLEYVPSKPFCTSDYTIMCTGIGSGTGNESFYKDIC